jgi:hypothetical protein
MPELANSINLWTVNRHGTALVLGAGPTGHPEPIRPAPILFKAAYVEPHASESALSYARQSLRTPTAPLLARMPGPDGPPTQIALLFGWIKEEPVTYVKNAGFTHLDYHLMQKMRILHGGTHIGRTLMRRAVSPELGLTVATGLVEVLRSVGIVA